MYNYLINNKVTLVTLFSFLYTYKNKKKSKCIYIERRLKPLFLIIRLHILTINNLNVTLFNMVKVTRLQFNISLFRIILITI
jgi:hypothetical protein